MDRARLDRRGFSWMLLGGFVAAASFGSGGVAAAQEVKVFKSPQCGCCEGWVRHLEANGFAASVQDMEDLSGVKRFAGVPADLAACHTAIIDGYTVEGHVPAPALRRLLAERPDVRGLAVPGMPAGSPGMPSPMPERYDVIAFTADGRTSRFMTLVGERPV